MSNMIETVDLGISVLGTAQVNYVVGTDRNCSYGEAVAKACIFRATALEQSVPAFVAVMRARKKKVEEISNALAGISATVKNFGSEPKTTDEKEVVDGSLVKNIMNYYGIANADKIELKDGKYLIKYEHVQKVQSELQYALDLTNNDLQQDIASAQNFYGKRDSAFQMATKLMKKAGGTVANTIKYIS